MLEDLEYSIEVMWNAFIVHLDLKLRSWMKNVILKMLEIFAVSLFEKKLSV